MDNQNNKPQQHNDKLLDKAMQEERHIRQDIDKPLDEIRTKGTDWNSEVRTEAKHLRDDFLRRERIIESRADEDYDKLQEKGAEWKRDAENEWKRAKNDYQKLAGEDGEL